MNRIRENFGCERPKEGERERNESKEGNAKRKRR